MVGLRKQQVDACYARSTSPQCGRPGYHAFCSACGSRGLHKQQLEDSLESLTKQASILREITRRQAEALRELKAEKKEVAKQLAHGPRPADERPPKDLVAELAKERVEIDQLQAELAVWRSTGGPPAPEQDRTAETRRAEQATWEAEKADLQAALRAAQDKATRLMAARPSPRDERRRLDSETAQLEDEAVRLRQEAAATERRAAALRQEVEAEKTRARQEASRQTGAVEEEMRLLARRREVEQELKVAQQAQLLSLRDTIVAVRQQIGQATRENTELRTALTTNQAVLHRLRQ